MSKYSLSPGANLTGTQVWFGSYVGGDAAGPIKWHVVAADADGNTVTLWTTTSVAISRYSSGSHENWVNSPICRWLNTGFLPNAFNTPERQAMETEYSNLQEQGASGDLYLPNQTIVLPSLEEMVGDVPEHVWRNSSRGLPAQEDRELLDAITGKWGITWTARQVHKLNNSVSPNMMLPGLPRWIGEASADSSWWLRTPGTRWPVHENLNLLATDAVITGRTFRPDNALGININGILESQPVHIERGIKPAFKLNLSRVLFASAAVGGKSLATVGSQLIALGDESAPVKLTIIDDTMPVPVIEATDSHNFKYRFSNAVTGLNRYLSCLLVAESSETAWYGKLADCTASGSGAFRIPLVGLPAGTYNMRIFYEQAEGDYITDRASVSVNLRIDVEGNDWEALPDAIDQSVAETEPETASELSNPATMAAAKEASAEVVLWTCSSCGNSRNSGKFCTECGRLKS